MIETSAPNAQRNSKFSFRFGIRTLIVGVAVFALLFVVSQLIQDWYNSVPISQVVDAFNMRAENARPQYGGPLSEDEVVGAIESQLSNLDASEQVKATLTRIARTRRIPIDASFDAFQVTDRATPTKPTSTRLWCINLSVMSGPKSGYDLRVREVKPTE